MHTARAGHVHVICPATHFSRLQVNHLGRRGLNLVDRLLWACDNEVPGAEGYKVHVPWGRGQLLYGDPLSWRFFLARITKLGIMVYLDKIIKTPCEEMAGAHCTCHLFTGVSNDIDTHIEVAGSNPGSF